MLSKFLRRYFVSFPIRGRVIREVVKPEVKPNAPLVKRQMSLVRSQYDTPITRNFTDPIFVLTTYWEVIPLLFVTGLAFGAMFYSLYRACYHRVDVKFSRESKYLYETMDMCHPTCHKLLTINQEYKPWPELAALMADMEEVEKRNYRIMMGEES